MLQQKNNDEQICKSVFKNGSNTISKTRFTEIWIDLINRLEKSSFKKA